MSEKEYSKKLSMKINWLNNKTMIISFNRKINEDEKIKIVLAGFSNLKKISSSKKIVLKYGYNK